MGMITTSPEILVPVRDVIAKMPLKCPWTFGVLPPYIAQDVLQWYTLGCSHTERFTKLENVIEKRYPARFLQGADILDCANIVTRLDELIITDHTDNLSSVVTKQLQEDPAKIVLSNPLWTTQTWFPQLHHLIRLKNSTLQRQKRLRLLEEPVKLHLC